MEVRKYNISDVISFRKTTELFGGLSNMCAGYSVNINGTIIPTTEHLYQACRFPNNPEIQEAIINEKSPMNAKLISRKNTRLTRPDWDEVRIKIMRWCLQIKLSQNWDKFSKLLIETEHKPIVEHSLRDKIWGAVIPKNEAFFIGTNALGRLLMELRNDFAHKQIQPYCVAPPPIELFVLFNTPINVVCNDEYMMELNECFSLDFELA